ncbi:MAG TPA: hypothetical protein VJU52_01300 [Flavobacterium sp.]|nr:hypothetical protein [Flavobacterium sp.]
MKKLFLFVTVIMITSCSSSSHICGGSGGKTCIKITPKTDIRKGLDT